MIGSTFNIAWSYTRLGGTNNGLNNSSQFNFFLGNNETVRMVSALNNVNYHEFDGSATTGSLSWKAWWTDTDISMNIIPKWIGKVGINVATPSAMLHVKSPTNTEPLTIMATAGYEIIRFQDLAWVTRAWVGNDAWGRFQFKNFVTDWALYLTTVWVGNVIIDNGNLGIGVIAPSSKLDVGGDIELPATWSVLLGPPATNGTWRITTSGANLSFQIYSGSAWVEKSSIAP